MQSSTPHTPRQSPPFPGGLGPADPLGAALTPELASVVAAARRRAQRDGDPAIDTAHLLHSLIESDPGARAALGCRGARVLGYLVQRSIGYGLRWRGAVERPGSLPRVPLGVWDTAGWSPSAVAAMDRASECARARGGERVAGADLLMALAADPSSRAVEVLRRAGVDLDRLRGCAEAA
ncbi:Clp protease N-terminal domain-containing protein [Streptomyces sp. NPDC057638]|uniref:Clp protease N-terminal domain-containing protein n=1 Tax=Streptomyces sp. NPDC057638 TaxID=3346190 RepID=UPI003678A20A